MNRPNEEEVWCDCQRNRVTAYLKDTGLAHGEIGDWPAWHVSPYVAIWAVESLKKPGWVGWWVLSGDLPTDYTSCGPDRHPREGLREIATRWKNASASWAANRPVEGLSIGARENWSALAPLLAARAEILLSYAADDGLWDVPG